MQQYLILKQNLSNINRFLTKLKYKNTVYQLNNEYSFIAMHINATLSYSALSYQKTYAKNLIKAIVTTPSTEAKRNRDLT